MKRISQHMLKSLVRYDPATGYFYRPLRHGEKRAGSVAHGYRYIYIDGKRYAEHALAWLYVYGEWPTELDHINRVKGDNRIANLRIASRAQNAANIASRRSNIPKGVGWHAAARKWRAYITVNGKFYHLGCFIDMDAAKTAYEDAARRHFGEFASD